MRAAFALPTDLLVQRHIAIPARRALRIVQVLQDKGAEVHMVEWLRWDSGLPPEEEARGLRFHRLHMPVPAGGLAARARFLLRLTARVRDRLVALEPEGIVVQDGELLWAAAQASRKLDVPLFYDSQEHFPGMVGEARPGEGRLYDAMERLVARRITRVYTVSRPIAERFERLGLPVTLLYGGRDTAEVDPHLLPREEAKRRLGLPADSLVLGYSGSTVLDSGLEEAIEALAGLPERVLLFVLSGQPAQLGPLRALAARHRVQDRVRFHGPVDAEEALRVGSAYDVGYLAFTGTGPNYEGRAPYKLFDLMAQGAPLVVSDHRELRRIAVEEGRFGLAVPPGDASAVRAAVQRLHDDEGLRRGMGLRARKAFEATYCGERQKEALRASHPFWR